MRQVGRVQIFKIIFIVTTLAMTSWIIWFGWNRILPDNKRNGGENEVKRIRVFSRRCYSTRS